MPMYEQVKMIIDELNNENNMIMETKKIEIEVPVGKTAKWIYGVLTLVDEKAKDTRPVTERVKTFEDACEVLGYEHPFVQAYRCWENDGVNGQADIEAYLKLRIICAALNEGWSPKFTKDEYRYYPWFYLYTKDEIEKMDEKKRNQLVLWGGNAADGAACGLASAPSDYGWSSSDASIGSRLCLKSKELSVYCGKQFINIWADFVL